MGEKFYVYFYYGKDDELLYIGKALDVGKRWICHTDSWKKEVCKIGFIECPDRASMDILEHYCICKYPTKYNVSGLKHGYTEFEISNLNKPTIYTLAEFREKFPSRKTDCVKAPIQERLIAMGNTIIDVHDDVNLFDKKLLELDLDRVCFKYDKYYLISSFSSIPPRPKNSRKKYRTNAIINAFFLYMTTYDRLVIPVKANDGNKIIGEKHRVTFPMGEPDCLTFLNKILRLQALYSFYEITKTKAGEGLSSSSINNCRFWIEVESINVIAGIGCEVVIFWHKRTNEWVMLDQMINFEKFIITFG